jgi:hypothetical protein
MFASQQGFFVVPYGLWFTSLRGTLFSLARFLTASSVRPSFRPMTRVGVPAASCFSCLSGPVATAADGSWAAFAIAENSFFQGIDSEGTPRIRHKLGEGGHVPHLPCLGDVSDRQSLGEAVPGTRVLSGRWAIFQPSRRE